MWKEEKKMQADTIPSNAHDHSCPIWPNSMNIYCMPNVTFRISYPEGSSSSLAKLMRKLPSTLNQQMGKMQSLDLTLELLQTSQLLQTSELLVLGHTSELLQTSELLVLGQTSELLQISELLVLRQTSEYLQTSEWLVLGQT